MIGIILSIAVIAVFVMAATGDEPGGTSGFFADWGDAAAANPLRDGLLPLLLCGVVLWLGSTVFAKDFKPAQVGKALMASIAMVAVAYVAAPKAADATTATTATAAGGPSVGWLTLLALVSASAAAVVAVVVNRRRATTRPDSTEAGPVPMRAAHLAPVIAASMAVVACAVPVGTRTDGFDLSDADRAEIDRLRAGGAEPCQVGPGHPDAGRWFDCDHLPPPATNPPPTAPPAQRPEVREVVA